MKFFEIARIALDSLLVNRLRSILTTLGIIIGVGAVIGLVSLGRGVEAYIAAEFESLGANLLQVDSARPASPTRTRIEPLTTLKGQALANPRIAPSVRQVAMSYGVSGLVVGGAGRARVNITGVTANYAEVRNWDILDGVFISAEDDETVARVAVLGLDVVEDLFDDRDFNPIGQMVRINDRTFTVIGTMTERGGSFSSEDSVVFIPLSTAQTRLDNVRARDGGYVVDRLYVQVHSEELMDDATREIRAYLTEAHGIIFADEEDFRITSPTDILNIINQVSAVLTIFLVLIASISLLVGGIGIMNIMLVSVTERTREIGLRKAVGAQESDILLQFLIESIVLSLVGGIAGIGVGWIASVLGTVLIEDLTINLSVDAVLLGTGVSTLVGVFFGYYPARRASRMKPIDALRFE